MRSREGREDNACFLNTARAGFSAQSYYLTPSSSPRSVNEEDLLHWGLAAFLFPGQARVIKKLLLSAAFVCVLCWRKQIWGRHIPPSATACLCVCYHRSLAIHSFQPYLGLKDKERTKHMGFVGTLGLSYEYCHRHRNQEIQARKTSFNKKGSRI